MDDTSNLTHRQAWDLIPWLVNGTASADERERVESHLAGCADCRDELAFHRALHAGMTDSTTMRADTDTDAHAEAEAEAAAGPALSRLLARIDRAEQDDADTPSSPMRIRTRRWRWIGGLAAVVAVQAVALAALTGLLYGRHAPSASYETLSRAPSAAAEPTIRLVAAPAMRLGELRALLDRTGLQIVQSSGDGAIVGLAPLPGRAPRADAVARLRAAPEVLLAEPLHAAAAVAK